MRRDGGGDAEVRPAVAGDRGTDEMKPISSVSWTASRCDPPAPGSHGMLTRVLLVVGGLATGALIFLAWLWITMTPTWMATEPCGWWT